MADAGGGEGAHRVAALVPGRRHPTPDAPGRLGRHGGAGGAVGTMRRAETADALRPGRGAS